MKTIQPFSLGETVWAIMTWPDSQIAIVEGTIEAVFCPNDEISTPVYDIRTLKGKRVCKVPHGEIKRLR